ncbi:MAG: GNAT family N-acetyltransferase [Cyclobacteriaceae bacterium]
MFNISEATEKDIPAIIDIAEKTWWPTYSSIISSEQIGYMLNAIYAPQILQKEMVDGSRIYLLLIDQGGLQGFASFGKRPEDPAVYKLHKLYVLPHNQARGYGRALIDEIKSRLLKENIHILDVNVNRSNPARSFYEKSGFKPIREEDILVGPYWMNDFVFRLEF